MLRETDRVVEGDGVAEKRFAREQRQGGKVVAVEPDQIEEVEVDGHRGDVYGARSRVLHPSLQAGERRHIAVERNDLAVRDEPRTFVTQDRVAQVGVMRRAILLVSGEQPNGGPASPQEQALPVELRLIHPRRIREDIFGQAWRASAA